MSSEKKYLLSKEQLKQKKKKLFSLILSMRMTCAEVREKNKEYITKKDSADCDCPPRKKRRLR